MQAEPTSPERAGIDRPKALPGSQVESGIDKLVALNHELDSQIDSLWEKLRGVILPDPPSPSATLGTIDPSPPASPVAGRIRERCSEVEGSIFRLQALRELLDL